MPLPFYEEVTSLPFYIEEVTSLPFYIEEAPAYRDKLTQPRPPGREVAELELRAGPVLT